MALLIVWVEIEEGHANEVRGAMQAIMQSNER